MVRLNNPSILWTQLCDPISHITASTKALLNLMQETSVEMPAKNLPAKIRNLDVVAHNTMVM